MRHGGKILIDQLEIQGATCVFTVPGESFLAALDGLYETTKIKTVICRQEGGAAMMADAWGKMTGRPGICFVTRGPGVANAMSGLHVAQQDSTPMVLFVGLPGAAFEDREAFQEIEIKQLFSSFIKWAAVIRDTARIPEYVSRAFHCAMSGRPGPVVLGLPEDMLSAQVDIADAKAAVIAQPVPSPADMTALQTALSRASRPLMIVGGPGWSQQTAAKIEAFALEFDLPVAAAFRCQDYIDNRHPCYVGHAGIAPDPKLATAIKKADLILAVGARLGEMTTSGYEFLDIPNPSTYLIHVHPSPDELGSVYRAQLPINATAASFAAALDTLTPPRRPEWPQWRQQLRTALKASWKPQPTSGNLRLEEVMSGLSSHLPDDAIITNGAGNYAAFAHRYHVYKSFRTQLAPTSGSMGYGLPAAIAAKMAAPDKTVVALAGDGCFMMTCQELATAVQYDLNIVIIIVNNSMFGTIRMHQERQYPLRVVGTSLVNPDFAAMARSFGAAGETVTTTHEFAAAFERALHADGPALIELKTDAEAITPRQSLSQIRSAAD